MAEAKVTLVIRPNGDIPFDDDHPHKAQILGELVNAGHTLRVNPDTGKLERMFPQLKPSEVIVLHTSGNPAAEIKG